MTNPGEYPKIDGDFLYASDYNTTWTGDRLYNQTINSSATVGDLVYYNGVNSEWTTVSGTITPCGMLTGTTQVTTKGYVSGLTGLSIGQFYYSDGDGTISTTAGTDKVGFSLSSTELLLDIDSTGYTPSPT